MAEESQTKGTWLDTALAALVAILGVLTAFAAYQSAAVNSFSNDNYFFAQATLADANFYYLESNQIIMQDQSLHDQSIIFEESDPDLSDYFFSLMTEEAQESNDRPDGPFDDRYFDALYADGDTALEESNVMFDDAFAASDLAVKYQLNMLLLAVGLSFAAWASILKITRIRLAFFVVSLVLLVGSSIQLIGLMGVQSGLMG